MFFIIGAILILVAVGMVVGPALLRRPKPAVAGQGATVWSQPTRLRLGTGLLEKFLPQFRQFADFSEGLPIHGIRDWYTRLRCEGVDTGGQAPPAGGD